MVITDPKFLYLILILPGIFGVTLIGEGIYKMLHEESGGIISIVFGIIFIIIAALAYFFFSNFIK